MKDMMGLVEPLIPSLRRYARSLLREPAAADELQRGNRQEDAERPVKSACVADRSSTGDSP